MMKNALVVALCCLGCGKVSLVPDASVDANLPDALSCMAPQLACGTSCVDPMTSNDHCGSCDVTCATGTKCMVGHCVDSIASCADIHAVNANAPSGLYTLLAGKTVYCDMTGTGVTYSDLSVGQYDVAHPDYTIVSLADFQAPVTQAAFIALINQQHGAVRLDTGTTWNVSNCCFKYSANAAEYLAFGTNNFVEPADTSAAGVTVCGGAMSLPAYGFALTGATQQPLPIPTAFFATHAPVNYPSCTDGANPAYYWKKSP
jgi:hypothetical protein